jgi:ribose transport system substrate-binding protein
MLNLARTKRAWLAPIAGTAFLLAVSACSSGSSTTSAKSTSSAAGSSSGGTIKMAYVANVVGDPFYITINCGAQAMAKKLGVSLSYQGPTSSDVTLQTPALSSVVAGKPKAILIAPADPSGMYAPIKNAASSGAKIVLVDTALNNADSVAASQVSSDNQAGGAAAADEALKLTSKGAKAMVISPRPGISTNDGRSNGFIDQAKKDGLTVTSTQYTQDSANTAASEAKAELVRYPDLKVIFATSLVSAEGAAQGVKSAGKTGSVKIIAFDAGAQEVQDLKDGTVQVLIAQEPYLIGQDAMQQAYNAVTGKPVTKKIQTKFSVLTKSDMAAVTAAEYKTSC